MKEVLITIITPVFNREDKIGNLYKSLINQTNHDFIWLIIDDGSNDGTHDAIIQYQEEGLLNIEVHREKNQGKHVAHNYAVSIVKTKLLVCVDSDDELVPDAVDSILSFYQQNKVKMTSDVAGIIAWKGFSLTKKIGTYPTSMEPSSLFDLYNKRSMTGDVMLIFCSNVIKQYPFPVFKGEKFLRESISYNKIDEKYHYLILDKILYIADYYEDGLSRNATKLEHQSPRGAALFRWDEYKHSKKLNGKLRNLIGFTYYNRLARENRETIKKIGLMFPVFWILSFIGDYYYKNKI